MAGVVLSSAPVVLPPLLVVSALGFAVSVPFGFVFASYACTHKLMTKLLPSIPEEEDEREWEEEVKREIEMRIENFGGEKNEEREMDVESPPATDHRQQSFTSTSAPSENEDRESIIIDEETRENEELERENINREEILMNDDAATDRQQNEKTQLPSAAAAADLGPHHREDVVASEPKKTGDDSDSRVIVNGHSDKEWESKIWEKINAIRVIVGFKAPRHSSYLEEVKALYLFTGIDPPSPSPSPSELDHNLSILMSLYGLK